MILAHLESITAAFVLRGSFLRGGLRPSSSSKYKDTVGGEMVKKRKKNHCKPVENTRGDYFKNTSADITCLV